MGNGGRYPYSLYFCYEILVYLIIVIVLSLIG